MYYPVSNKNDISDKIIQALIYSKFEDIGPMAIAWYPTVDRTILSAIALKSINLFTAEDGKVPESISVIPFSINHQIGIVKCFEIPDKGARGGARDATLTLLVDENYNNLVLRYTDRIDQLMNNVTGRILVNEQINAELSEFKKVLKESFAYIIENIEIFQVLEQDREEFEPKIENLKAMISEIENLVEDYIKDVDQFGTNEVKEVLKLAWDLKRIDLYEISPEEIKHIIELANKLKMKKESIIIQKRKLKQYKDQMTANSIKVLDKKIDTISNNLEKFLEKLFSIVNELAKRSEKVIKTQSKAKDENEADFLFYKQLTKLRADLKQQLDLFQHLERLSPQKFQIAKEIYQLLEKMRTLRRNKDVGKAADDLAKILKVDRNQILEATRDPKTKEEFNKIFQLS